MKKNFDYIRTALALLLAASIFALTACASVRAENLIDGIKKDAVPVVGRQPDESFIRQSMDFAAGLFKKGVKRGENSLISPLSVMVALAMTANGAEGKTLEEMLAALGGDMTESELNEYLCFFLNNLPNGKNCRVVPANSIWIRNDFEVEQAFLKTDADYYGADVFHAPFDENTAGDINRWVKKNTDGMIDGILNGIDPETVMYLVNALIFEAEWKNKYEKNEVHDAVFHAANGQERQVTMMYSTEKTLIETNGAKGFIKPYLERFSFAALLPDEGIGLDAFIDSLDGAKLYEMLNGASSGRAAVGLPKFRYEFSASLKDALTEMGMERAFEGGFGRISSDRLRMGDVLHKTFIEVAEQGTRAGAVSAVPMPKDGEAFGQERIILDRPFVYMIIDNTTMLPIFIGTLTDIA